MNMLAIAFWTLLAGVVASAERWGDAPERSAGRLFAGAALLTLVVQLIGRTRYHGVDYPMAGIDVLLLTGLCLLSIRYDRWWLPPAAAILAIPVLAHLAKLVNPGFWRLAYAIMASFSGLPTLVLLGTAIALRQRRTPRTIAASSNGSSRAATSGRRPRPPGG